MKSATLKVYVKGETLPQEAVSAYKHLLETVGSGEAGFTVGVESCKSWYIGRDEDGRYYLNFRSWGLDLDVAPNMPDDNVEITGYSADDIFECREIRLSGYYSHEDASARLETSTNRDHVTYHIHLDSVYYPNMQELYRLIRAGKILPTKNWDAPQTGPEPETEEALD